MSDDPPSAGNGGWGRGAVVIMAVFAVALVLYPMACFPMVYATGRGWLSDNESGLALTFWRPMAMVVYDSESHIRPGTQWYMTLINETYDFGRLHGGR